jgi:hypothetical protein
MTSYTTGECVAMLSLLLSGILMIPFIVLLTLS